MYVVRLEGGLGNQLFQLAFGMALEAETGTRVLWEGLSYREGADRELVLPLLRGNFPLISRRRFRLHWPHRLRDRLIGRLVVISPGTTVSQFPGSDQEKPDCFRPDPPAYFVGFWQSARYFERVANQVRDAFVFAPPLSLSSQELLREVEQKNSVAVHLRRGDYHGIASVREKYGVDLSAYYVKGLKHFTDSLDDPHFFLFSDDPGWVRDHFPMPVSSTLVDFEKPDWEDLHLMSRCRHNLTANSTFSWWSAWLNPNPEKIVVSPQRWYNEPHQTTSILLPEGWVAF